jgi:AraC-like DNA-binding protein
MVVRSIVGAFSAHWQTHHFGDPAPVRHQTLFYLEEGEISIAINEVGREQNACRGDIVWLPRDTVRTWHTSVGVCMYVIRSVAELPGGYPLLFEPGIYRASSPCHATYLCQRIVNKFVRDDFREYLEVSGLFAELLGLLLKSRYLATFAPSKVATLSRVLEYLAAHFGDSQLTLQGLIAQTDWSRGYFMRVFREYTGETPMGYLRRLRVNAAAELLKTGDWTVTEVAYHVGFSDPAYFSRVFARYVGHPPSKLIDCSRGSHKV